jgi:hypothetical protein
MSPHPINRHSSAAATLALALCAVSFPLAADDWDFSGSIQSSLSLRALEKTDSGTFSVGAEQYANFRLKAASGERGTVYAAANFVAASGNLVPLVPNGPEAEASATDGFSAAAPFVVGADYAAAIELERLYYRVAGDDFDFEAGLLRPAFGYGQAWSPSDFLSTRNPLLPDARPRGVLAATGSVYPGEDVKLKAFAVAGDDPLNTKGDASIFGFAGDWHMKRGSIQGLYALETAASGWDDTVHHFGLSLKIEAGVAFVADALYELDAEVVETGLYHGEKWTGLQGLRASAGIDYSFLDGDLFAVCQYLYSGDGAFALDDGLLKHNYLYAALSYRIDDYTNTSLSCVVGLDDASATPSLSIEHEPFQGLTLVLSGRIYLGGNDGELGPELTGMHGEAGLKVRLKL